MKRADGAGRHVDRVELLAWTDGELQPERSAELTLHLGQCPSCSELLAEVRGAARLFSSASCTLDVSAPAPSAAGARRGAAIRARVAALPAAAVVLLLAGVAFAMVPGSSLGVWLRERLHRVETAPVGRPEGPSVTTVTLFSVLAPDSFEVRVEEPRDSLVIRVVRSAGPNLSVDSPEGAMPRSIELGERRLRVVPGSVRLLTIVVPRGSRAMILAGGQAVLDLTRGRPPSGRVVGDSVSVVRLGPAKRKPGG